jgi:DNA repair protein RecN (Recombination protein N)
MISFLKIRNLATIENVAVDFAEGFSILTGETGAGKSIIIDSIRLALGEKGTPELIRTGKKEASVESVFQIPENLSDRASLSSSSENEVFIQRQITEQGSGKAYLNGVLVPAKKLKELSSALVDIYGQNDHIFLLHLENHLNYLDSYIDVSSLKEEVAATVQELRTLVREKRELEAQERERELRLDFLSFQIKEIEKAQLKKGEEEELQQERNILKNAENITSLVEKAFDLSYAQEDSVFSLLAKLQHIVQELGPFDPAFCAANETFQQFAIAIREFSDFLVQFKEKQTAAPEKLEILEERLNLIEKLKRKYGANIPEILLHLEKARQECQLLSSSQERLGGLEGQIEKKFIDYQMKAEKLSRLRRQGSLELEKQVEKEIALLGMNKAKFKIKIETIIPAREDLDKVKENGTEDVEFLISPNPGEELRPLRKIASGGELSRIMLALKTIGKERERLKTLIFDEIDSGIGGKTAEFIAQRLKELSKRHQVLCITHLPQIASFATHHYKIDKKVEKKRTFTTVKKLEFEERVTEIARLLSGTQITETALKNAREMLEHNLQQE